MKTTEKPAIKGQQRKSPLPPKYVVADLNEVRAMFVDLIHQHIEPKCQLLEDKATLNVDEAVIFLTEECGHRITKPTLYVLTSQLDKAQERGSLKRITRPVPHTRVGKYIAFEPCALREWAEEQVEASKTFSLKPSGK